MDDLEQELRLWEQGMNRCEIFSADFPRLAAWHAAALDTIREAADPATRGAAGPTLGSLEALEQDMASALMAEMGDGALTKMRMDAHRFMVEQGQAPTEGLIARAVIGTLRNRHGLPNLKVTATMRTFLNDAEHARAPKKTSRRSR